MMTLLLRLAGPMQSWGTASKFRERDTEREPSKSGVVGLVAAALGRPRTAPIADLAAFEMGVRVDHEGVLQRDYQTVGGTHWSGNRYARDDAQRYGVAEFDGEVTGTRSLPIVITWLMQIFWWAWRRTLQSKRRCCARSMGR